MDSLDQQKIDVDLGIAKIKGMVKSNNLEDLEDLIAILLHPDTNKTERFVNYKKRWSEVFAAYNQEESTFSEEFKTLMRILTIGIYIEMGPDNIPIDKILRDLGNSIVDTFKAKKSEQTYLTGNLITIFQYVAGTLDQEGAELRIDRYLLSLVNLIDSTLDNTPARNLVCFLSVLPLYINNYRRSFENVRWTRLRTGTLVYLNSDERYYADLLRASNAKELEVRRAQLKLIFGKSVPSKLDLINQRFWNLDVTELNKVRSWINERNSSARDVISPSNLENDLDNFKQRYPEQVAFLKEMFATRGVMNLLGLDNFKIKTEEASFEFIDAENQVFLEIYLRKMKATISFSGEGIYVRLWSGLNIGYHTKLNGEIERTPSLSVFWGKIDLSYLPLFKAILNRNLSNIRGWKIYKVEGPKEKYSIKLAESKFLVIDNDWNMSIHGTIDYIKGKIQQLDALALSTEFAGQELDIVEEESRDLRGDLSVDTPDRPSDNTETINKLKGVGETAKEYSVDVIASVDELIAEYNLTEAKLLGGNAIKGMRNNGIFQILSKEGVPYVLKIPPFELKDNKESDFYINLAENVRPRSQGMVPAVKMIRLSSPEDVMALGKLLGINLSNKLFDINEVLNSGRYIDIVIMPKYEHSLHYSTQRYANPDKDLAESSPYWFRLIRFAADMAVDAKFNITDINEKEVFLEGDQLKVVDYNVSVSDQVWYSKVLDLAVTSLTGIPLNPSAKTLQESFEQISALLYLRDQSTESMYMEFIIMMHILSTDSSLLKETLSPTEIEKITDGKNLLALANKFDDLVDFFFVNRTMFYNLSNRLSASLTKDLKNELQIDGLSKRNTPTPDEWTNAVLDQSSIPFEGIDDNTTQLRNFNANDFQAIESFKKYSSLYVQYLGEMGILLQNQSIGEDQQLGLFKKLVAFSDTYFMKAAEINIQQANVAFNPLAQLVELGFKVNPNLNLLLTNDIQNRPRELMEFLSIMTLNTLEKA